MTEERNNKIGKWVPYVIVSLIAAALIVVVLLITNKPQEKPEETVAYEVEHMDPALVVSVTATIKEYYRALSEADAETLNRIVEADEPYDAAELAKILNLVEEYVVKDPYIIKSKTLEDRYIAYVTYAIVFKGFTADAGAPALDRIILYDSPDGVVIDTRFVSEAFDEELAATESSSVVQNLKKQVESDLQKLCASNADIKALIDFMKNNTVEPTEEASEEPTEATETEEVSEEETEAASGEETEAEPAESGEGSEEAPPETNETT